MAGRTLLLEREEPVGLGQLRVGVLHAGGGADEDVQAEVVARRHLVGEPAKVELALGDIASESVSAQLELRLRDCGDSLVGHR
ncbi:MAG TPA: hypothetical protein VN238_13955 [Solirubrobacteraceae bacterium]|nr:hypothetical protein [Solirubrobacteraceae bacterium]